MIDPILELALAAADAEAARVLALSDEDLASEFEDRGRDVEADAADMSAAFERAVSAADAREAGHDC